ncbi:MAG: D-2-hydroxyacid dehydrogenase [Rhodospirillaceae bacterium]|nr:D-2-hydroxyacid dehydrogenase [Rhodospirillaceae bacterium]
MNSRCPRVIVAFIAAAIAGVPAASRADTALSPDMAELSGLGLVEHPRAARDIPGWKKPTKAVVWTDSPERLAWFQAAVPGVTLVAAATPEDAMAHAAGAQALVGFCDVALVDAAKDLHWLQLPSAGLNSCGRIPKLQEPDAVVTNMQRVFGPPIGEHVIALMLALTRGLDGYVAAQRDRRWDDEAVPGSRLWEVNGKTMLVVGLGGIGTSTAQMAHSLGMRIIATRNSSRDKPDFVDYVGLSDELPDLISQADVVVNATPLTPQTRGLFNAALFAKMKKSAYFINIGRGQSVVQADLVAALNGGVIAGAGLDVTDPEPLPKDNPLWTAANVIITPHVSSYSDMRTDRVWLLMRENLRRYAAGDRLLNVVDLKRGY